MPGFHPEELGSEPLSYAIRRETPAQVLANRLGITSLLFGVGMVASVVLGRHRG